MLRTSGHVLLHSAEAIVVLALSALLVYGGDPTKSTEETEKSEGGHISWLLYVLTSESSLGYP